MRHYWFWIGLYAVLFGIFLIQFLGCGSSNPIFCWKPTIIVQKDSEKTMATASPTQPVTISDNTATGIP